MPKITLSLASEVIEILKKHGKSPYEVSKEIIVRYTEKLGRIGERSELLASIVGNVYSSIQNMHNLLKSGKYNEFIAEVISDLKLLEIALTEMLSLPLSRGERTYAEFLRDLCRILISGRDHYSIESIVMALIVILLTSSWIMTLLLDIGMELEDLGLTEDYHKILDTLNSILISIQNLIKT